MLVDMERFDQWLDDIELETMDVDCQLDEVNWWMANVRMVVNLLLEERLNAANNWEAMRNTMLGNSAELIKLRNLVEELMVFWVALQHGPGNPVVVDNQEDNEREEDEWAEYFTPPVIPELGALREIDEDEEDWPPEYE